jgi:hypothetical protein
MQQPVKHHSPCSASGSRAVSQALTYETVRFLGNPIDVPVTVMAYVAAQLGIEDASVAKAYLKRDQTRLEHRWEIQRVDGWSVFAGFRDALRVHVRSPGVDRRRRLLRPPRPAQS